jgi:ADP-ribosylglycohydrolase
MAPSAVRQDAPLDATYRERVYAGVLGKLVGVYLGRPFESWTYDTIRERLGEIDYYVNDRRDVALKNHRLVVPDDDITGTFTFARAIADRAAVDAASVGRTWLNYLVEDRTVLWWGGRGVSTEHTAYLLLRDGVQPPETGSAERNGRVVAEQVGAQIFVEAWAMACPGDPERAAALAAEAASVSHDGEALNAARVVAALVAHAFVEPDVDRLLDVATALIDRDSLINRLIDDLRGWHAGGDGWRRGRERIDERYGYHRYAGNCHVVPNHALVVHALLHGDGDFTRSLRIVTACGWDTDSNGGNVGCIAGVRGGLAGIEAEWLSPIGDRLYLPTADGGGAITDAAREAITVVGYAHTLRGLEAPAPKSGARFHFSLPGSVQGFAGEGTRVENDDGRLALRGRGVAVTPTFLEPDTVAIPPYGMAACPTLYPGQRVRARVIARTPVRCRLVAHAYDGADARRELSGPELALAAGETADTEWVVPDTGGHPIADVGLAIATGTVLLDHLTWDGEPDTTLSRPADGGSMWRHAWVNAVDSFDARWPEPYRIVQNRGTGLLITGTREWRDYEVTADVMPRLARAAGLAARVQGLRRYYALRLVDRRAVQLVRMLDTETVLAERPYRWDYYDTHTLRLTVTGGELRGEITGPGGGAVLEASDPDPALRGGGIALLIDEGHTATDTVRVRPVLDDRAAVGRGRRT